MMKFIVTLKNMSYALLLLLSFGWASQAFADDAFRDMQGNITSLEAQQSPGKFTVVMIWASNCHVCNQEANAYSDFHMKHADEDAKIIGLSIDGEQGKANAEAFIERNGVIFPNLIGDVGAVARWYQSKTGQSFRATPTFMVFGPEGKILAANPGAVPPEIIEEFIATKS